MKTTLFTAALLMIATSAFAEEKRQAGAHVHGHGTLNIVIDKDTVSMEFEAPGNDIVGFENEPSTPEQKAAVEKAKATLANPLSLFKPTAAAGCTLKSAEVKMEAGSHDHAGHDHTGHDDAKANGAGPAQPGTKHADFDGDFTFQCADIGKLTGMTFDYFKLFPAAEELDVTVVTPKGQTKFEVTRAKPTLSLAGVM